MQTEFPIDIVITWLDSDDPDWQKIYHKYRPESNPQKDSRYRNWNTLKFWFRRSEEHTSELQSPR